MTDQPTRMIFARKLTPGATIIDACGKGCPGTNGVHTHQLNVLDVMTEGDITSAIVVREDGEQAGWERRNNVAVRIVAVA